MTDPVDDLIRDQMRDSFPLGHGSSVVLEELRPQMIRARTHRRAIQTSAGLATLSAVLIGVLLVLPQLGGASSDLDVAGPEGSSTVADPENPKTLESPPTTDELGRTVEEPSEVVTDAALTSPTVAPEPSTTVEPSTTAQPATTEATTSTEDTATTETTTAPTTAAPTTTDTTTTSTTAAPTTTETTTTTTAQTSGLVTTPCGSLVAEIVGSGIGLVSTNPNSGFTAEVKDSGPTQVEVHFEGEGQEDCEVTVENRNGQIWSDDHEEEE